MRFLLYCNAALSEACLRQLKILVGHLLRPRRDERLVKHAVAIECVPFWAERVRFMFFGLSPFHTRVLRLVSVFQESL